MKFSINKEDLLSNLQLVAKAAPARSTLPIINSALFTVNGNQLIIRSTDLEISLKLSCSIEKGENGSVAIPLSKLLEITNAMPNQNINFDISDIGKVNIECNQGNYTIMSQPSEEFPAEQILENTKTLVLPSEELKNIINNTSYSVSKDDLKPVLQGVLFQTENKKIIAVSTDGHRLVKIEKDNINSINYNGNVVIPIKFLNLLNYQINESADAKISIGDNHIEIDMQNIKLTSRIIKDPYPDYESVIPKENNKTLIVNKKFLLEAIKRISIFSNKSSKQIALEITENKITITTEDPENITTGKESMECNYDGEPMIIGYNALYLKEVLQHQQAEEIKIMLNTPLNAGLFIPLEQSVNNNITTLLMPIRLND